MNKLLNLDIYGKYKNGDVLTIEKGQISTISKTELFAKNNEKLADIFSELEQISAKIAKITEDLEKINAELAYNRGDISEAEFNEEVAE